MFFDSDEDILKIAKKIGFSIFVLEEIPKQTGKNIFNLAPDEKTNKISIDSVRDFLSHTTKKREEDEFFIINYPEKMNLEASNAFLKNLEEPNENYHFVFLTKEPDQILKTILSRAQIFVKKTKNSLEKPIKETEEIKAIAKKLIVSTDKDLPKLAEEISKKKDRNLALKVISTAIEISYKTFFLTNDPKFLKRLQNLIKTYECINANGNIKLHIVADML